MKLNFEKDASEPGERELVHDVDGRELRHRKEADGRVRSDSAVPL